ncbi:neuropeptide FF receptor 1-like [Branchiostoma floridae]|uniref:Neuropeptide FF receptor 1-like n=1 Tax=Branchiostoma floridae TaxID=7739 RepID=A0A9J7MKC7_BRAFL|nr:neuropeptide FF receptor 1-like [Branchiostoma floridae]
MNSTLNTTSPTPLHEGKLKQTVPIIVLFVFSYTLIFLFCIIGNTLVCLVVVKSPRMQNVTNYFILNLAVADLLVAVFCMPFTLVDNIVYGWPFGDVMCKLSAATTVISVVASVLTLVAIAVDRYCAVVYPTQEIITLPRMMQSIAIIWFLSVLIALPVIFAKREETFNPPMQVCTEAWPTYGSWSAQDFRRMFSIALLMFSFLGPLLIITILYMRIAYRIWFRKAPGDSANVSDQARETATKKKVKVIKMLIVVVVLFALSWLPLHTLILLDEYAMQNMDYTVQNAVYNYCFPVAHWLSYFNSCVNPIIYGYFNQNFRAGFKAILTRSRGNIPCRL